ncbi:hydroxysqualene dehydroxylase [Tateyamaria pelophila]|uniref:hydroxysqualene dehydroxylase n=1 Tax=Tateyamaria pelophila TaxID=328415 RepID=UPI001CBC0DF0|nr:FAD-dependent oxidoreductase [Tateyamaria pelophila]
MAKKVIILGGGVGGMSAAHELIERGFEVEVVERQMIAGGKARSIPVMEGEGDYGSKEAHIKALRDWLSMDGYAARPDARRAWLPGEHGFRFFPNFYKHIVNTMERIPFYDKGTVADNLVDTTRVLVALYDKPGIVLPERFPRDLKEAANVLQTFLYGISPRDEIAFEDIEHFSACIWRIMTTCKERRFDEYERIGWWEFIGAEHRSEAYQKFLAIGITRSLVAAKARTASTKTIGDIFMQLLFGIVAPEPASNRLLNAPTNVAWIQPWLDYIRSKGVVYHFETTVTELECRDGQVTGVMVEDQNGTARRISGDYYIGALPIERMATLITKPMIDADPGLALLTPLARNVQWMNGIQFYLKRDVRLTDGHVIFIDSSWALTAVSQHQFWSDIDFENWGDGKSKGLLSVDISQWDKPGLNGKDARACTREEIAMEVWAQMKRSLNVAGEELLCDEDLHYWFLDPDIQQDPANPGTMTDVEPLLVNRVNTWRLRPDAATQIPNFCLASDYVRTNTDLATMEGANEAARRAVNAIIEHSGSDAIPCKIWDLHEPDFLEPMRAYDKARYHAGLPWDDRLAVTMQASLKMVQTATGTEYGGQGPLAAIGPIAGVWSEPTGRPLNDPALSDALRMIGPPKDIVAEMAKYLPGFDLEIPGTKEVSGLATDLAEQSNLVDEAPWPNERITAGPHIAQGPSGQLAHPMGGIWNDNGPDLPARRLSVRQID